MSLFCQSAIATDIKSRTATYNSNQVKMVNSVEMNVLMVLLGMITMQKTGN